MPFIKPNKIHKNIFTIPCIILLSLFFATPTVHAQDNDSAALAVADTINFSCNTDNNWQLYNSYVGQQGTGSVILELILQHDNNINWSDEQYVGKIKSRSLFPGEERSMKFLLAGINYRLRIVTTGECYLKVVSGDPPVDDPVILPFTIIYNK